jgi:hypothetical protein
VVGTVVYGRFNPTTTSGIARLDLESGRLEELVTFAAEDGTP